MRDLVYYVATSVDGYVADVDGDWSSFPQDPETLAALFDRYPETCPVHARDTLGVTGAPHRFDTVLMGRRTCEPTVEAGLAGGAYPHLRQIVATHHDLPGSTGVETICGDVTDAVARLKAAPGHDIWLCGGPELAAQLVDLIDEIQVKVNPVLLGHGLPLLPAGGTPRPVRLAASEPLPGGVLLQTYRAA